MIVRVLCIFFLCLGCFFAGYSVRERFEPEYVHLPGEFDGYVLNMKCDTVAPVCDTLYTSVPLPVGCESVYITFVR